MKKNILILLCCLIALSSCQKSGVNLFVGNYSFKTSGEVSLTAQTAIDSNNIVIPAEINASLSNDIGQLNICVSDMENDEVIVIINYMNGDVVTTHGICNGNTIALDEFERNTLFFSINTMLSPSSTYVTVGATGQMYDDIIVFDLTMEGTVTIESITCKIKDKNIQMVAYRN